MRRAAPLALALLGLAGCAVLTIDVDVYKGALANHEDVQIEQIAAMAMGAKPIIAELRYQLERAACLTLVEDELRKKNPFSAPLGVDENHPDVPRLCPALGSVKREARAVGDLGFASRDARRVNGILSLYEPALSEGTDALVGPLLTALRSLVESIERGFPVAAQYVTAKGHDKRLERVDLLARKARGDSTTRGTDAKHEAPTKEQVKAVQAAAAAALDAWTEALRLLASPKKRQHLATESDNALWAVAWIAADLTSASGIRCLLLQDKRPGLLPVSALESLAKLLPVLGSGKCDDAERELPDEVEDSVGAVVARQLADDKTGPVLAEQLLAAQNYAGGRRERNWFVVIHPTARTLSEAKGTLAFVKEDFTDFLALLQLSLNVGLEKGRPHHGIQDLITQYLTAKPDNPHLGPDGKKLDVQAAKRRLFDGLVNFAEKVTVVANFDVFVRGAEIDRSRFTVTDTERYTRVLEAVGNSILTQVDALRQKMAHDDRLSRMRPVELKGLRNAENRAVVDLLRSVIVELRSREDFPDRGKLLALLEAGPTKLKELQDQLATTRNDQKKDDAAKRKAFDLFETARVALVRPDVAAIRDTLTSPPYTTNDVFAEIKKGVKKLAADARAADPPKTDDAVRWDTLGEALGTLSFDADSNKKEPVNEKFRDGQARLLAAREKAELEARTSGARVSDLERWTAIAARASAPGVIRLMLAPGLKEKEATAKDVLDQMLAALRYEHVLAVRDAGRGSEIVKDIEAAIGLAYTYRSGMIHIRPATTYLRNSYPATALQQDPTAGVWKNMLREHAGRQLPFAGLLRDETVVTRQTIDRQFWQRVNQVRVAGAGRTNYVVAKDDVGNWYVKSYSADPKDIIESAKNLALFSAGPALGANFLAGQGRAQRSSLETVEAAKTQATGEPASPSTGTTQPTTKEARSTLGRQLDRVTTRYREQTLAARKKLKTDLEGLDRNVRAAAGQAIASEAGKLDTAKAYPTIDADAVNALGKEKADDKTDKPTTILNAEIAAALRAVRSYRDELNNRIVKVSRATTDPPDPAKITNDDSQKARDATDKVLKGLLDRHVRERQSSAAQYEAALMLIGETAGL